jgi:ATP-dependent RNA helicase DeaD
VSYFLENEEVVKEQETLQDEAGMQQENEQDGIASIEPLLDNRIVRAIREMGFEKLSPIQEQAIPYLLQGEDIIGQAQTGTGKTAAFGIPAIQHINPDVKKLQTIILCPTRELAIQAAEELRKIAKYMHGIKVLPVYGGQDISRQIAGLRGVQIIVGTPGRVMDHMRRHTIKLDLVNMVVLDEADEMLNMGFREDMELILGQIPGEHQTALFSATMPKPILEITDRFQKDAKLVKVAAKELTIPLVSQKFYRVKNQDKDAACVRLLEYYQPKLTLIFCNTKKKVDELADLLKQQGFQAEGLHGDLSQAQRDVAMNRFRNGGASILIATDVAARGIDVDDVEAVINYDIPQDIEYYVHRIGRTGRAGRKGRSFTFANSREIYKIREIERVCHTTITEKKLPGAAKVLKAKADKYLNNAWELHEHEDIELMKSFLQRKMEEEGCDALELAAAMLKYQVGDKGEEIAADEYAQRRGRFGERGRFGRGGDEGRNFGRRGGRRRDNGRDDEEHRERRRFGRGDGAGREDSRDGENSRFGRSDRKRSGRDKKTAERKLTGDREERERKKRKKKEEPGIGNSFPKRKR